MSQDQLSIQLETENRDILHRSRGKKILVSFSGGSDSVFVLLWLRSYFSPDLIQLIYFDHGVRSRSEIDAEIEHNYRFAKKMGVSLFVKKIPVALYQKKYKTSFETASRNLRLSLLTHYARIFSVSFVVMGHHLDDQCETFVSKLVKGLQSGYPGIRREDVLSSDCVIWRPLISLLKTTIVSTLERAGLSYVKDSSNNDRRHERNRIRLDLLPHFKSLNMNYQQAFKSFIDYQSASQQYFQYVLDPIFDLLKVDTQFIKLPIGTLAPLDEFIRQRVIVHCLKRFQEIQNRKYRLRVPGFRLSQVHVTKLSQAVQEQKKMVLQLSITEQVKLTNTHFICEEISKKNRVEYTMDLPAIPGCYVLVELGKKIRLDLLNYSDIDSLKSTGGIAYLSFDKIKEKPLYVRNRRPQDQFHPFGSSGSKSLKKYMIDKKIPAKHRQEVPLFFAGNTLVWVMGYQIHHDYQVTDLTNEVLKIEVCDA